jgi:hypothetical protein
MGYELIEKLVKIMEEKALALVATQRVTQSQILFFAMQNPISRLVGSQLSRV